jgi:hypothetical protein
VKGSVVRLLLFFQNKESKLKFAEIIWNMVRCPDITGF